MQILKDFNLNNNCVDSTTLIQQENLFVKPAKAILIKLFINVKEQEKTQLKLY